MEFSTLAAEELAQGCRETLLVMRDLLMAGSNHQEVTLGLVDGHAWKVSRALGLISVEFVCPGDGPHMDACVPPDDLTEDDVTFLDGKLFKGRD